MCTVCNKGLMYLTYNLYHMLYDFNPWPQDCNFEHFTESWDMRSVRNCWVNVDFTKQIVRWVLSLILWSFTLSEVSFILHASHCILMFIVWPFWSVLNKRNKGLIPSIENPTGPPNYIGFMTLFTNSTASSCVSTKKAKKKE